MDKVSCIYRISHKLDYENENVYIGSTVDLYKRKREHKHSCINEKSKNYKFKLYQYIRENGGWDNFQFTILRVCNDADKKVLIKLEQSFIDVYEPTLNTNSASQTKYEWYEIHKERINKQKREVIECECGKFSVRASIARHRKTKHHQEYLKFNE